MAKSKRQTGKDTALAAILREWDAWARSQGVTSGKARGVDGMTFFNHLQAERRDLLDFRVSGDKWQVVHAHLLRNRKVAD